MTDALTRLADAVDGPMKSGQRTAKTVIAAYIACLFSPRLTSHLNTRAMCIMAYTTACKNTTTRW